MCVNRCHPPHHGHPLPHGENLLLTWDRAKTKCVGHRFTHVAAVRCSRLATNLREDQVKPCKGCAQCPRRARIVAPPPPAPGNDPFAADAHAPKLAPLPQLPPVQGQAIDLIA